MARKKSNAVLIFFLFSGLIIYTWGPGTKENVRQKKAESLIIIQKQTLVKQLHKQDPDSIDIITERIKTLKATVKERQGTYIDLRDGKEYKTIEIGSQVWMAENLATTKLNDGALIPNVTDNSTWSSITAPSYCWYNNDSIKNKAVYGALYNRYAVDTGKLCPIGWHMPTEVDWDTLEQFLGDMVVNTELITPACLGLISTKIIYRGPSVGGKLKEAGITHWKCPNSDADNISGFTALPGGLRSSNGDFHDLMYYGYWWSALEGYSTKVSNHYLGYKDAQVNSLSENNKFGFSARCLRD
jgi:uncharacterized protein (TIGR02145 family)